MDVRKKPQILVKMNNNVWTTWLRTTVEARCAGRWRSGGVQDGGGHNKWTEVVLQVAGEGQEKSEVAW